MNEQEKIELERQRLEFEKEKLEFEKKKFETNTNQNSGNNFLNGALDNINLNVSGNPNYVGIAGAIALIVSCFLPWVESHASGYGHSFSASINGFTSGHGYFIIIFAFTAIFLAYKRHRFLFIPAGLAFLDGLSVVAGIGSFSSSAGGISARAGFAIGPVITILSSALVIASQFISFSIWNNKNKLVSDVNYKEIISSVFNNRYFVTIVSLIPLIPAINLLFIGLFTNSLFLFLLFIGLPTYVVYKKQLKGLPYLLILNAILVVLVFLGTNFRYSGIIENALSIFKTRNQSMLGTGLSNNLAGFIFIAVKGLALAYYLAAFAYLVTIVSSSATLSKRIPIFLSHTIINNYRKVVFVICSFAAMVIIIGYGYQLLTEHEPTEEEKQSLLQKFAPLSQNNWFVSYKNKNVRLSFSPINIRRTESSNRGRIYYSISANFDTWHFNDVESVVECSDIGNISEELAFKYCNCNISLVTKTWSSDSVTGIIIERNPSGFDEKEYPFVAYSESMIKNVQLKLIVTKLTEAQARPSMLEGVYRNYGEGYSSFADIKMNSDGNLTLQEGSADGDVSLDPLTIIKEYKLIENKLFIKGESSYSPGEMIDLGAFTFNPETQKYELVIRGATYKKD